MKEFFTIAKDSRLINVCLYKCRNFSAFFNQTKKGPGLDLLTSEHSNTTFTQELKCVFIFAKIFFFILLISCAMRKIKMLLWAENFFPFPASVEPVKVSRLHPLSLKAQMTEAEGEKCGDVCLRFPGLVL